MISKGPQPGYTRITSHRSGDRSNRGGRYDALDDINVHLRLASNVKSTATRRAFARHSFSKYEGALKNDPILGVSPIGFHT